ncbi:MAG: hypothetical protein GY737_20705 [Desulfobacteraceae bacterium]|nr:hypothetical protein [Desulfobacteraceae bacterium]
MQMHSDHPTFDDKLDRSELVNSMANQIINCEAPQAFGLHGDWGAGKTSFLRQLRFVLDGSKEGCNGNCKLTPHQDGNVVTVWFDAWRYQYEATPVVALLQEIRRQFSTWEKIKNKTEKLSEVAVISTLNSLGDVAKLVGIESAPIDPQKIKNVGEQWEKEHLETRLGVDTIQEYLEKAIDSLLKTFISKNNRKLVIIIDDLDRCSPESAFRLLEGLKVYLNIKRCVFVIGMNQQLVVDSIAKCMPSEFAPSDSKEKKSFTQLRAEAYLEKICTSIIRLIPPSSPTTILTEWLEDPIKGQFIKALGDYRHCLPPNPRKLKALANLINKWGDKIKTPPTDTSPSGLSNRDIQILTIITYIYQFHSEIFQRLQFSPEFYSHLKKWTEGTLIDKEPPYFVVLTLPSQLIPDDGKDPVPSKTPESTFPDPYSPCIFWIAPIIQQGGITEEDITPILEAISK